LMNYKFGNSFGIGKIAVNAVTTFLATQKNHLGLTSVEDSPKYRNLGIDILWVVKDTKGKRIVPVEVKADRYYHTGNLYLETISNTTKGSPGCFVSSCAAIYAYFFVGPNVLYWIPLKRAQEWFSEHQERFPIRLTSTGNKNGEHLYKTEGRLVPRSVLVAEVPGVKVVEVK
jgi:hypothetical protein